MNDYYPFGMLQPGRDYTAGNSYRYGFNGKEHDKNISEGDYDFGARIFDARIGKWLGMDTKAIEHPYESPFEYVGNNPLLFIDPDGNEKIVVTTRINKDGSKLIITQTFKDFYIYKHVNVHGFGNDRYYKSDLIIHQTLDYRTNTATIDIKQDNLQETSQANYDWQQVKELFGNYSGGRTDESRGSQASGVTLTSQFAEEADGAKTDATQGASSDPINIDLILAGFSGIEAGLEADLFTREGLGGAPEMAKKAKELGEAVKNLKDDNENNKDNNENSKDNKPNMIWQFKKVREFDTSGKSNQVTKVYGGYQYFDPSKGKSNDRIKPDTGKVVNFEYPKNNNHR